ncbi:MAG: GFA family protein [Bradyrhizobium sp.]
MQRDADEGTMQGSCLCGAVEFRVEGFAAKAYQCHCSLCRKQGGTSASLAIIVEARNFSWVAGREQISSYVRPTGFRSDFCASCGSPVPNPLRTTAYYWVPTGSLDDAETVEIAAHLYTGSKASWESIPSDAPHFETVPKLSHLIELLSLPKR